MTRYLIQLRTEDGTWRDVSPGEGVLGNSHEQAIRKAVEQAVVRFEGEGARAEIRAIPARSAKSVTVRAEIQTRIVLGRETEESA